MTVGDAPRRAPPAGPLRGSAASGAALALLLAGGLRSFAVPVIGTQAVHPRYEALTSPFWSSPADSPSYREGLAAAALPAAGADPAAPSALEGPESAPAAAGVGSGAAATAAESYGDAAEPDRAPAAPRPSPQRPALALARARAAAAEAFRARAGAGFFRLELPPGIEGALLRLPGRGAAAARFSLAGASSAPAGKAGIDALALSAIAAARSRAAAESPRAAAEAAGASLELVLDGFDEVALELTSPIGTFPALFAELARSLAALSVAESDFASARRALRLRERETASDPASAAKALLRPRSGAAAAPEAGDAAGLAAATLGDVVARWKTAPPRGRLAVAVAGDLDPSVLESALEAAFAGAPSGPVPAAVGLSGGPSGSDEARTAALPGMRERAFLRAELAAPPLGSPDYPALSVAMAAFDDLLAALLPDAQGGTRPGSAVEGGRRPRIAVEIPSTADPAGAKAAIERASALLADGLCLDPASAFTTLGTLASGLLPYKARALAAFYGGASSAVGAARAVARDLAEGGPGDGYLGLAARIEAVTAAQVSEAARRYLSEAPAAWAVVRDPAFAERRSP